VSVGPRGAGATGSLAGRVVLVTGGGAGIGRGIVEACHDAGARVVVGTLEPDASYPDREGVDARTLDVADPDAVRAWVNGAAERHGRIDGLVNNAGITLHAPFLDTPLSDLERLWAINQRAPYLAAQAVARCVLEGPTRGGEGSDVDAPTRCSIVNIASNHARASDADYEMYAATRAAIVAMTRAMAWSLGPHGIRVNSLSPGLTLTEAVAAVAACDPAVEATFRSWHATGRRYNRAADLGACAAFLLSDASVAVNGADLVADQGMSARLGALT